MAFAYGLYNFGDGYYSETKYVDAAATASVSSSLSADSERIHLASSDVTATGSVSSTCVRIHQSGTQNPLPSSSSTASASYLCNASALVEAQNAVTTDGVRVQFSLGSITTVSAIVSNAERIQISSAYSIDAYSVNAPVGFIVAIGGSSEMFMTSGSSASGKIIYLGDASGLITSSTDSSGLVIKDGLVDLDASASASSTGVRIHLTQMSVDMQASVSADAFITAAGVAEIESDSDLVADSERIHLGDSVVILSSDISASGQYKYEPIAKDNETWNDVPASGGTWNDVPASGGTWTEVA
jgi:hypothetical protein